MTDLFIIYSSKDIDFKNRLVVELTNLKYSVPFSFFSDADIETGDNWNEKIKSMLRETKGVIILLSPNSMVSSYVRETEIPICIELNKKIFGLCIEETNLPDYISQHQLFPKTNEGLVYLKNLSEPEKKERIIEFSKKVVNYIAEKKDFEGVIGQSIFHKSNRPEDFGRLLAEQFNENQSLQTFKLVIDEYIKYYEHGMKIPAINFIFSFNDNVKKSKRYLPHYEYSSIDIYSAIIETLKNGLPKPTHFSRIYELRPNDLLRNPAYAKMLNAMAYMEKDKHSNAKEILNSLKGLGIVENCCLYQNLLAKSNRKLNNLPSARNNYSIALDLIVEGKPDKNCPCLKHCNKTALEIELNRGIGTVYRELDNYKDSLTSFEKAIEIGKSQGSEYNKELSQVYYSLGYLKFEKLFEQLTDTSDRAIYEVIEDFEYSFNANKNFMAPLSRMAIVKLYQKEFDEAYSDFTKVIEKDINKHSLGIEAEITISWCYISIYHLWNSKFINSYDRDYIVPPIEIDKRIDSVLAQNPDIATLKCHANDIEIIFKIFNYLNKPIEDKILISILEKLKLKIEEKSSRHN